VRKISAATGDISTIAGTGYAGFSGDGGSATEAEFGDLGDLGVDAAGNLYIADSLNQRVRKVTFASGSPTAATPVFSPVGGTYPQAQLVTISAAPDDAQIYYTTNGETPTANSTLYTGPVEIAGTRTLKAIAIVGGDQPSAVAWAAYTTPKLVATPVFTPNGGTHAKAQTVRIVDATKGASIYYTTDGTTPTAGSTPYTGPFEVSATETIQAIALVPGDSPSNVASTPITIETPAAAPAFSIPGGTYAGTQTVTITDATPGATIYFSRNGSAASPQWAPYSKPITVSASETIEAVAKAPGSLESAPSWATYTIQ
jgi:hypothetical protein